MEVRKLWKLGKLRVPGCGVWFVHRSPFNNSTIQHSHSILNSQTVEQFINSFFVNLSLFFALVNNFLAKFFI